MSQWIRQAKSAAGKGGPLLLAGALAGLAASVPMGLAMLGLNQALPGKKRDWVRSGKALPPRQIFRKVARRAGARGLARRGSRWDAPTWLAHMGYGAATASVYPLLAQRISLPAALSGVLFALAVWAASYLGWLPAMGILPPATEQPARRNGIMLSSHVLWGLLTGLISHRITENSVLQKSSRLEDYET